MWLIEEILVGVRGFEPPTPASRRQCSTKLSYTPTIERISRDLAPLNQYVRLTENSASDSRASRYGEGGISVSASRAESASAAAARAV